MSLPCCFLTPKRLQSEFPLFVFLPGMDGTGELLRTQTSGLEAGFDVRCLAIPPTDQTSWDDLAKQVIVLTQAELQTNRNRPIYLCGESFGGCLALKVALVAPHLFNRIVLINPASSFRQRPWMGLSAWITNFFPEPLYRLSSVVLLHWLANLERIESSDRQALLKAVNSVPQKTSVWRLSLLNDFVISQAELQTITAPVLLVAGTGDRLLPSVAEVRRLAGGLPNAQVELLPSSGHTCLLEAKVNLYNVLQRNHFLP
jgi:pimeloyl-ACP methyl ester carboxylesterase